MSDTDKTKPWRVRVMEHRPWANHDHRDGVCNLPATYGENRYYREDDAPNTTHCRWSDWNLVYKDCCCYGCGCPMCTDQAGRKRKRRRERQAARHAARRAVTGIDMDPVIARDTGW